MSGDGQLRAFIERILRLKEEQDSLAADIREIYAEAKGSGFDKTAMGQLVSHLRKVEKVGADAVEEGQTVFDLYLDAYRRATGTPIATHTHEAAGSSSGRTAEFDSANAGSNPAPVASGELTDTQEQPETANALNNGEEHDADSGQRIGRQNGEQRGSAPVSGADGRGEGADDGDQGQGAGASGIDRGDGPVPGTVDRQDEDGRSRHVGGEVDHEVAHSNPQPAASLGNADSPASTSSPEPGSLSDADVPAFLKPERRKPMADYRPHCKHPDNCGSSDPTGYCYQCRRAMEAASETEAA